jgi:integrase/recombinase XerD
MSILWREFMEIWVEKDNVIVKNAYGRETLSAIKKLKHGKWLTNRGVWQFPLSQYSALCAINTEDTNRNEKKNAYNKKLNTRTNFQKKVAKPKYAVSEMSMNNSSSDFYISCTDSGHTQQKQLSDDAKEMLEIKLRLMNHYMTQSGYSVETIKNYTGHLRRYLIYANLKVEVSIINGYMVELLQKKHCSHAHCNQAINAIKLFCRQQGYTEQGLLDLVRPKKENKLPKVISKEEVKRLLDVTENEKHKTALMLAYSCGMRVSEVANLQMADIQHERLVVIIRQGKGRKDRIVPLSKKMIAQLDVYKAIFRPGSWVFDNQNHDGPISKRTLQAVFNKSKRLAKINPHATFHSLRHSYATHLLDVGVDLRLIQELLGHASSKTTEIYTHVTTQSLQNITNPLDDL